MKDTMEKRSPCAILLNATKDQRDLVISAFNQKDLFGWHITVTDESGIPDKADLLLVGDQDSPGAFINNLRDLDPSLGLPVFALCSQDRDLVNELQELPDVIEALDISLFSSSALAKVIKWALQPTSDVQPIESIDGGLHEFLQYIADGIIIVDEKGIIKEANSAAQSIFGYPEGGLEGGIFGFPTVAGEKTEIDIVQPDGKVAIAEMNVAEVSWKDKPCLLASIRDITSRKVAKKRMGEALELAETIISSSPLGICTYKKNGQCVSVNDSMAEMIGIPKETILNQNLRESPFWSEMGLAHEAEFTLTTSVTSHKEVHSFLPGGKEVWFDCYLSKFASSGAPHLLLIANDIQSMKQAESQIRRSEKRFRAIFEAAPVSIWEIDYSEFISEVRALESQGVTDLRRRLKERPDFVWQAATMIKTINVNIYTLKTFGAKSKSELLGPISKALHPESMKGFVNELIALAEGQQFLAFETVRKTLDNKRLDVLISLVVQEDSAAPYKALVTMVDITERKQAESRLARELDINEALTELFVPLISPTYSVEEIAGIVLEKAKYLTGSEHGYVSEIDPITGNMVSHTLTKMMGKDCEVHHETGAIFPIGKNGKFGALWGHSLNTRTSILANSPTTHPFSTGLPKGHIPVERFLAAPVVGHGNLLGQIALANSDRDYDQDDLETVERLASYYALALQRKRMEDEILDREERFRQLAENIHEVFLLIDVGDIEKVDYVSPAYEQVWGLSRDDLYKDPRAWLKSIHPDDRLNVEEELESCLKSKKDFSSQFRIIRPDRSVKWVWFKVALVLDNKGAPLRIIGLAQDITQLKKDQAEQKRLMEEIQRFAYIVSHDLRAPLINLKGFSRELKMAIERLTPVAMAGLDNLEEDMRTEVERAIKEDVPESLEFINSSATKMNSLINGILRLSRLGRSELFFETVDMNEIVSDCLKTLAFQISEGNVRVNVDKLHETFADRMAIDQIMNNLIGNALKFMANKDDAQIWIGSQDFEDETLYYVRDNGPGIQESDLERIFEVFSRVGDQSLPGEGMGLAYVRTLVSRHGGSIWCESSLDSGATFKFTISKRLGQDSSENEFDAGANTVNLY